MIQAFKDTVKNLWFQDPKAQDVFINETAVRIRAGILLVIPVFMLFTFIDIVYGTTWIVDGNTIMDTYETDWDDRIIYSANVTKRTYEYSLQTYVLFYALFEMIASMFVFTSRFSPTIYIASFLTRNKPTNYKPLVPKRFAWSIGVMLISICLVYFHPEIVAQWVNVIVGANTLPETSNWLHPMIPFYFVWACLGFMWLEAILGFCVGCQVHALLVWMKILDEPCEACNNIDWDAIRAKQTQNS